MAAPDPDETLPASDEPTGAAGAATDDLPAGTHIGRYLLVSRLGSGGMGVVYAAYDPELDRTVAIKVVHPGARILDQVHARFVREARAMARISHRGVVPIHDVGTFAGSVFLAMELVDGPNARTWLDEARPSWRRAVATLLDAGRGLAAAHAAGIVHRDVKPANVLIGRDGRARVTDFGLARTDDAPADPGDDAPSTTDGSSPAGGHLTRTGAVLGTPAYMAPEQHRGGIADARSDQFSFCVLLYEAAYGERPFRPADGSALPTPLALAAEVSDGRVRPAPRSTPVPPWLRRILLRGLAVEPAARWPSLDALIDEIEATPARRRRPLLIAGGAVALACVGAAFAVGRAGPGADPCTGADALIATAWSPADRSVAIARLAGLSEYGRTAAPRIGDRVDGYASAWSSGHRDACVAHRDGLQSDALFDRRVACLERGRGALAALAGVVASTGADDVAGAVTAAQSLPDPAACGDVAGLLAAVPPPPADKAARAAAIASVIDRARVLVDAGRYPDAEREATAAVADARALGHPPLLAQALAIAGRASLNVVGGRRRAIPVLDEAAQVAIGAGDVALGVEAWARREWARGTTGTPSSEPIGGLDMMVALSTGPASTPFARAVLDNSVGAIEIARGRRDEARRWFERALVEKRQVTGPGAFELVAVHRNIGRVTDDAAQRDAILADAERQLELSVGIDHPETLLTRVTRSMWSPDLRVAAELLRPACDRYQRLHASLTAAAAQCWNEIAYLAEELGNHGEAVAAMDRAAAIEDVVLSPRTTGYRLLWHGDPSAAAEQFDAAIRAVPPRPDEPWWDLLKRGELELGLARARRAANQPRLALAALDAALRDLSTAARMQPAPSVDRRLTRTRADLAVVMAETGDRSAAMRDTARAAASSLRASGGRQAEIDELVRLAGQ